MRKIILLVLVIAAGFATQAQNRLSWGVEAGLNLSHPIAATAVSPGVNVGVFGEMQLSKLFSLDAALRYSYKPWRNSKTYYGDSSWDPNLLMLSRKYTGGPSTLELPIHAGFTFPLSRLASLKIAVGPYFGIGVGGKYKMKRVYTDTDNVEKTQKESHDIYGKNGSKRFETGLDARVGVEFNRHYNVSLGYQFQFNETTPMHFPIGKAQVFSVNVGYRF
ncbi:MAG: PorT family protein [Muribaculaceae bacterium]|nr:PorT family protein [Muribaculaceae bacterium]